MKQNIKNFYNSSSTSVIFKLGFLNLLFIAFSRPILTVMVNVGGPSLNSLIPVAASYVLLLLVFFVFNKLLKEMDAITLILFLYILYCLLSILWGSDAEIVLRNILPFIVFFAAKVFLDTKEKIRIVLFAFMYGYTIPILGSAFLILTNASVSSVEYYSQVERQLGLYLTIHECAHSMGFFSVLFGFYVAQDDSAKFRKCYFYFLFILSLYVLWNTYTRSAYIGVIVFWLAFLFQLKIRYGFYFFAALVSIVSIKISTIANIFLKTSEVDLNAASSGRLTIWENNLELFLELPFYKQILGNGFGIEKKFSIYDVAIYASHNDWLTTIVTIGFIGFFINAIIVLFLLKDILLSNHSRKIKAIYSSPVFMIISITILTNYIGRFAISQSLWLFIGCFYGLKNKVNYN